MIGDGKVRFSIVIEIACCDALRQVADGHASGDDGAAVRRDASEGHRSTVHVGDRDVVPTVAIEVCDASCVGAAPVSSGAAPMMR